MLAGLEIKDFAFSNNIVICEPVVILFSIKIEQINMALPVLIFIAMIFLLILVVFEPFKVFLISHLLRQGCPNFFPGGPD